MPRKGWKKNPETVKYEAPEGLVETAPRKRHDPDDAPVDGFYRYDSVVNKEPGKRYYLLDDDDAIVKVAMGARMVERRPGGAKPLYDRGSDADSGYRIRGLTLYEMPEALAKRHDAMAVAAGADRMSIIRNEARRSPGGEYVEETVSA